MIYDFSVAAWPPGRPLFFARPCPPDSPGQSESLGWFHPSINGWCWGTPIRNLHILYTMSMLHIIYIYIFFIYAYIFILSFVYVESDICFCSQKMVHIVYILWYSLILDVYCIVPFVSSISLCTVYNRILYPGVFVLYIYIYIKYY